MMKNKIKIFSDLTEMLIDGIRITLEYHVAIKEIGCILEKYENGEIDEKTALLLIKKIIEEFGG